MKVLLLGANGWLAQFFYQTLLENVLTQEGKLEIFGTYHRTIPGWIPEEKRIQLDVEDFTALRTMLASIHPDVVLHFAAISSPLRCHQDESFAYQVNAPGQLLREIQAINPHILYLFTSTDMVYDGEKPPYTAEFETQPVNVYGRSKLQYEHLLLHSLSNAIILRLSNMLGPDFQYQPCGEKFLEWLKNSFTKRQFIGLKDNEIRSFVDVKDVCQLMLTIIKRFHDKGGAQSSTEWIPADSNGVIYRIYNVGGPSGLSRLQIAQFYCESHNCELTVIPQDSSSNLSQQQSKWNVYIMDPTSPPSSASNQLVSPRDITMDCRITEEVWQIRFKHPHEYLRDL